MQSKHTKTKKLTLEDKPKEYLTSNLLSLSLKQFLFLLRCNMTKNKTNFKQMFLDLSCRLCLDENSEESLLHLSVCPFVKQHVPEISNIAIYDIHGEIDKQTRAAQIWKNIFSYIEEIETYQEHTKCASCTPVTCYTICT